MKQTKGLRRVFSSSSSFAFTSNQKQQQPLADQINNPPPSSSSSPYALLKSMKSEPDAKWALKLFYRASMLPGYRPILPVYDKLISKLARSGHVSSIESLLHHMKSEACNLSEGFCINLINIYGESRLPHKAMTFFSSEMEALGCKRSVKTFNTLLNALYKSNWVKEIHELYAQMGSFDIGPDVCTFNILIKCGGDSLSALRVFQEMKREFGIIPNIVSYSTLITCFCREGLIGEAMRIMEEMAAKGCAPDVITYNALMDGFCKKGKRFEALKLMEKMVGEGCRPDDISFFVLVNSFCFEGQLREAYVALNQMIRSGLKLSVSIYNALLMGLFKCGKVERRLKMYTRMVFRGCVPTAGTYETIINGCCRVRKNYVEATVIVDEMLLEQMFPSVETLNCLIHVLCSEGEAPNAARMLRRMNHR
ncbi:hypothetical protein AMTRI_Chr11g97490 [Amborella trichopoda]